MDILRDFIATFASFLLPLVIVGFPVYGVIRKVRVYEAFVVGAKEGFTTAIMILPYLVAILFAFAMFRASGALDVMTQALHPLFALLHTPPEILPMAIVRPLSGSGSFAILSDNVATYGRNSEVAAISATIYASTETTFYVLAVYFGAVNVRKTRHALPVGLIADIAAVILAVIFVKMLVK
ncbi:MAG: spore maturation protein [Tepidisphaeraceae bacterium]